MKNIVAILVMVVLLASCDSNDNQIKYSYSFDSDGEIKREMSAKNATTDIEVEMVGSATFSPDNTMITGLTPGGYINYRNENRELTVEPGKDGVKVTIEENGRAVSKVSDTGKEIIAEAIRHIKKLQDKYK